MNNFKELQNHCDVIKSLFEGFFETKKQNQICKS